MKCCCGHDESLHLGGPDLDQAALNDLHAAKPGGDGGMCRAAAGEFKHWRCDCFNFCDCLRVVAEDSEVA